MIPPVVSLYGIENLGAGRSEQAILPTSFLKAAGLRLAAGQEEDMELVVKWWLEEEGGLVLGKGRCMLLEAIDRVGSLREAARVCGISYRAAWGKLRTSEARLGEPLATRRPGKRGMELTARARELLQTFHKIEAELTEAIALIEKRILRAPC